MVIKMKVLITGAASGIGYETGIRLAKLGCEVILTVHKEEEIEPVLVKVKTLNLKIICFKLDITKENDRKKILEYDLDCLINNAGIGIGGSLLELPLELIKENFEVNVFSTLRLSQIFAADLFLKKKKGKIIFMSSLAGIMPISFLGSYCMTKASIRTMATVLKRELKLISDDIQVKLIEPGIYNTGFNELMIENKLARESNYFKDLENITLKQKKLFNFLGKDNLDSITRKIVASVFDNTSRFSYQAPFFQVLGIKLYTVFFQ